VAFGSGVLVASLAYSLIEEAFKMSQSIHPVIIGFVSGGLAFTIANYCLANVLLKVTSDTGKSLMGSKPVGGKEVSGTAILVGSVMDNIPENMAPGILLAIGGSVDLVLLAAIFISNFPEGLSSSEVWNLMEKVKN
jgi:ZIP family zinc transporter